MVAAALTLAPAAQMTSAALPRGIWCGTGYLYCSAPACQLEYGPYCDANRRPDGPDTEYWPRPHVGDVPYGKAIFHCKKPGTIALTFDDGPWKYTEELLDVLEEYGVKATFFLTGRNLGKGAINDPATDWPRLIHRMKADGHQIASHTWSHQRLPKLSKTLLRQQMIYNEIAIADILGFFPTYMRPPYSASNEDVDKWLADLGYHVTYFDLDTEGYLHDSEDEIEISKSIVDKAFDDKDSEVSQYLHIEHDTVYETVSTLVGYTIDALYHTGFTPVTVGECLNDPEENWYRWPDEAREERKRSVVELGQGPSFVGPTKQSRPAFNQTSSGFEKFHYRRNLPRHIFSKIRSTHPKSHTFVNRSHVTAQPSLHLRAPVFNGSLSHHLPPTNDGRCGPVFRNATCSNQKTEKCCSKFGWCGSTEGHCFAGCQEMFGHCGQDT
ncbi:polysaccharide deacetylase [Trichoderma arundinaceum]|uniref:Polysaccharide deacetylase n=1 Tax=Trichoderma arundinaceum TaxID=490622 RepID=A0A395NQM2_TRIAR|nr:polysaccharide deacetylase [Trichoderma arundinaceum]